MRDSYQNHVPADGCNYTTLLRLDLPNSFPSPSISVFRGFVGVDATVAGETYRFVTTHLEVQEVNPAIQQSQAKELVDTIGRATPPERPVILVGDFNSAPTDPAGSAYDIIRAAAYADTWQRNLFRSLTPGGFTCCQASALTNDAALLNERIDLIFVKNNLGVLPFSFTGLVFAVVIGDKPISRLTLNRSGVPTTLAHSRCYTASRCSRDRAADIARAHNKEPPLGRARTPSARLSLSLLRVAGFPGTSEQISHMFHIFPFSPGKPIGTQ